MSDAEGAAGPVSSPLLAEIRNILAEIRRTIRTVPKQARLALGRRGVVFASAATIVGLFCFIAAFAQVALSLRAADVRQQRDRSFKVLQIDQGYRDMMRDLAAIQSGAGLAAASSVRQDWRQVQNLLRPLCAEPEAAIADIEGRWAFCEAYAALADRFTAELAAFDPPRRNIDPAVMGALIRLSGLINAASVAAAHEADSVIQRMIDQHGLSLLVLTLSTLGFAGAGLVLLGLVGRTSVQFHAQWSEAQRARDRLQETIDALPAGVLLYDRDERLVMFNDQAVVATPLLKRPDAIGLTYEQVANETARLSSEFGAPLESTPQQWIARFRSKGNRARQSVGGRWFEFSERATRSGGTVAFRVDVTDLKTAELAARHARREYETLVNAVTDTVHKIDFRRGTIAFVSAAAAKMFGVPPPALIGRPFLDHVLPDDHQKIKKAVRAARFAPDAVQEVQYRLIASDGTVRHIQDNFRRSAVDGDTTLSGVMRDVSRQVELAQRLDEEMARLRSIVESSGAIIVLTDRDLRILMVNREFEQLHGLEEKHVVGRPLTDVVSSRLDPAVHARWRDGLPADQPIAPHRFRKEVQDRQGRRRMLNMTAVPVVDDARLLRRIVFLGVDDTERLEAEQALFQSERLATVGEMAATVAHEIAQPLQVIDLARSSAEDELAQAEAGGSAPDVAYVAERLARIGQQIERANRIVSDLRAFVRGHAREEAVPFDPAAAVRSAVDLTQHALRTGRIALSVSLPERLPVLKGHVTRLEQVLVNLINNARDAGGSAIEVRGGLRRGEDGPAVWLTVADNGPGIPEHILPRLFRGLVTTKASGKGTGLGLRICRRIVEEMGGTIAASNRAEGGARFEIVLPAAE